MHTLTVELAATYLVGVGQWVVHNAGICPIGMTSSEWEAFQSATREFVDSIDNQIASGKFSLSRFDINVQGSRVPEHRKVPRHAGHQQGPSDIDVLLRVNNISFKGLVADFKSHVATPTDEALRQIAQGQLGMHVLGSRKWNPKMWDIFWDDYVNPLNLSFGVDFSILRAGSKLNTGPFLRITR